MDLCGKLPNQLGITHTLHPHRVWIDMASCFYERSDPLDFNKSAEYYPLFGLLATGICQESA